MKGMYTRVVMMLLSFALLAAPAQAAFVKKAAVETTSSEAALKSVVTDSWKSLSRSERKSRIREVKDAIRNFSATAEPSTSTLLLVILAILLPPLAVFLHEGALNNKFWISLLLTILFFVPGIIYALYVILS